MDDKNVATDNDESIYVKSDWVGIGTSAGQAYPNERLVVQGGISQRGTGLSVFLGAGAGQKDDLSNNKNVAIGDNVLTRNSSGESNVGIGHNALFNSLTVSYNTAVGTNALQNSKGMANTALGYMSLGALLSGNNNIGIGNSADVADRNGSNQVRIGNSSIRRADIQVAWTVSSDIRWKKNVIEIPYGLDLVMGLQPVDYIRKDNSEGTHELGFIAQDVDTLLLKFGYDNQGIVSKNTDGYLSVRYNDFIPLLTKAIQEQQAEIISLKRRYNDSIPFLTNALEEQQAEIDSLKNKSDTCKTHIKAKNFDFSDLPVYCDESNALDNGLTSGAMYITPFGELHIKL